MLTELWSDLRYRVRALVRRRDVERELDEELRFHVMCEAEKYERAGLPRDEALRRARLAFGGVDRAKEQSRDARGTRLVETTLHDLRYALRTLRRAPAFTTIAVLTLALGIGATTAIFSVVDRVLLRPLPYTDAQRLTVLAADFPRQGLEHGPFSGPEYEDIRAQVRDLLDVAAFAPVSANVTGTDRPERIQAMVVSTNFFSVLGVAPALGRTFRAEDDGGGIGIVAVISHDLWQRMFAGDPNVVGRTLRMDDDAFTIIGVMPSGFHHPVEQGEARTELWVPTNYRIAQLPFQQRSARFLGLVGRLAPGATLALVHSELGTIAERLAGQYPDAYASADEWRISVTPLFDAVVGHVRSALVMLLGAVALVLLIGCVNIANLLLARGAVREREIALRTALGAGRARIVRQLLTESVVLAAIGGTLGLLLAAWGADALTSLGGPSLPRVGEASIDARVFLFAALISVLTGIAFGIVPALQVSRANVQDALKDGARGATAGSGRARTRSALVVAEVALALVLLISAGLLLRSFARLAGVDPGFEPRDLLTMQISLPVPNQPERGRYFTPEARRRFTQRVIEAIEPVSGVKSVGIASPLPLRAGATINFAIDGRAPMASGLLPSADFRIVSPGYFHLMGTPLLAGRELANTDDANSPLAAVINRTMAHRFWPGESPIGKRIRGGAEGNPWLTIVGVAGDVHQTNLDVPPRPEIDVSYLQHPVGFITVLVRTAIAPERLANAARQAVRTVDKDQPVYDVVPMTQVMAGTVGPRRFSMILLAAFGALALLLAVVGISGVVANVVAQRQHEIGIRMALGAAKRDVLALIVGRQMAIVAIGIAVGLGAAAAVTRVLSGLLYEVGAVDPITFIFVPALLLAVALVASYLPARRAMRVDPAIAMRNG